MKDDVENEEVDELDEEFMEELEIAIDKFQETCNRVKDIASSVSIKSWLNIE